MPRTVIVARASEIEPGHVRRVQAGTREIALCNVAGVHYAVANECPHQGSALGEGTLSGEILVCPGHQWEFDVRTGECLTTPGVRVAAFKVQVEAGEVSVLFPEEQGND